ncbi:MAG TPA: DUF4112 domain-containing protein [Crinalium sp.]|jgi:hypothetical protein
MPPKPELIRHDESALQRIRVLSHLLDNAIPIPGTSYRVGLDPVLGLLPVGGDVVGLVLSIYIVLEAIRFRLPRATLTRMLTNLLLDFTVGALPVVGDVMDFTWKSNARNLELLEAHVRNPHPQRAADRQFIILILVILVVFGIGFIVLMTWIVSLIWKLIGG